MDRAARAGERVEAVLTGYLSAELGVHPGQLDESTDLRELGVESLKVLRVIAKIERDYDVELPDELVFKARTVRDVADAVRSLSAPPPVGGAP